MTAVRIRGLTKQHGPVVAVDHIDLDVESGELVVLLGPSGCGKTTTLRSIAGFEDLTAGEIYIGDELVSSSNFSLAPEKRAVGMVFQSYALWPHMTVAENLAFGLKLRKLDKAKIDERVQTALELVGLDGMDTRYAGELSGGQQQRVALARAIALEPQILLFDEPLSNLDAKMRERMRFEVRQLQKRLGITAIYVTHDQQEAMAIADRIVLMNAGRIEQQGEPRDLYDNPRSRFAADFIGTTNVLSGRVTANGQIRLNDAFDVAATNIAFTAGANVDVLIRPEHIRIGGDANGGMNAGANHFDAIVTSVCFLGNIAEVDIEIAGQPLHVQLSPPGYLKTGDALRVSIDPANVVVLDSDGKSGQAKFIHARSAPSAVPISNTETSARSAQGGAL